MQRRVEGELGRRAHEPVDPRSRRVGSTEVELGPRETRQHLRPEREDLRAFREPLEIVRDAPEDREGAIVVTREVREARRLDGTLGLRERRGGRSRVHPLPCLRRVEGAGAQLRDAGPQLASHLHERGSRPGLGRDGEHGDGPCARAEGRASAAATATAASARSEPVERMVLGRRTATRM